MDALAPPPVGDRCLIWAPRTAGLALAVALPVVAIRSFVHGVRDPETIIALVMHLLLSVLLLTIMYCAWHRPWIGLIGALSAMAFYLWTQGPAVPWNDSTLITEVLPILGLLYAWKAVHHWTPGTPPAPRRSGATAVVDDRTIKPRRPSGGHRPPAPTDTEGRPVESLIFLTIP